MRRLAFDYVSAILISCIPASCSRGIPDGAEALAAEKEPEPSHETTSGFPEVEAVLRHLLQEMNAGGLNVPTVLESTLVLVAFADGGPLQQEGSGVSRPLLLGPGISARIGFSTTSEGFKSNEITLVAPAEFYGDDPAYADTIELRITFYCDSGGLVSVAISAELGVGKDRRTRELAEKGPLRIGSAWFSGREQAWSAPLELSVEQESSTGDWMINKSLGAQLQRPIESVQDKDVEVLLGALEALSK